MENASDHMLKDSEVFITIHAYIAILYMLFQVFSIVYAWMEEDIIMFVKKGKALVLDPFSEELYVISVASLFFLSLALIVQVPVGPGILERYFYRKTGVILRNLDKMIGFLGFVVIAMDPLWWLQVQVNNLTNYVERRMRELVWSLLHRLTTISSVEAITIGVVVVAGVAVYIYKKRRNAATATVIIAAPPPALEPGRENVVPFGGEVRRQRFRSTISPTNSTFTPRHSLPVSLNSVNLGESRTGRSAGASGSTHRRVGNTNTAGASCLGTEGLKGMTLGRRVDEFHRRKREEEALGVSHISRAAIAVDPHGPSTSTLLQTSAADDSTTARTTSNLTPVPLCANATNHSSEHNDGSKKHTKGLPHSWQRRDNCVLHREPEILCRLGCGERVGASEEDQHQKESCGKKIIECPFKCTAVVTREDMPEHLKENCPYRSVPCDGCWRAFPFKHLNEHGINGCRQSSKRSGLPYWAIWCPFGCGAWLDGQWREGHFSRCPNRAHLCDCGMLVPLEEKDEHLRSHCDERMVECYLCHASVQQKAYAKHLLGELCTCGLNISACFKKMHARNCAGRLPGIDTSRPDITLPPPPLVATSTPSGLNISDAITVPRTVYVSQGSLLAGEHKLPPIITERTAPTGTTIIECPYEVITRRSLGYEPAVTPVHAPAAVPVVPPAIDIPIVPLAIAPAAPSPSVPLVNTTSTATSSVVQPVSQPLAASTVNVPDGDSPSSSEVSGSLSNTAVTGNTTTTSTTAAPAQDSLQEDDDAKAAEEKEEEPNLPADTKSTHVMESNAGNISDTAAVDAGTKGASSDNGTTHSSIRNTQQRLSGGVAPVTVSGGAFATDGDEGEKPAGITEGGAVSGPQPQAKPTDSISTTSTTSTPAIITDAQEAVEEEGEAKAASSVNTPAAQVDVVRAPAATSTTNVQSSTLASTPSARRSSRRTASSSSSVNSAVPGLTFVGLSNQTTIIWHPRAVTQELKRRHVREFGVPTALPRGWKRKPTIGGLSWYFSLERWETSFDRPSTAAPSAASAIITRPRPASRHHRRDSRRGTAAQVIQQQQEEQSSDTNVVASSLVTGEAPAPMREDEKPLTPVAFGDATSSALIPASTTPLTPSAAFTLQAVDDEDAKAAAAARREEVKSVMEYLLIHVSSGVDGDGSYAMRASAAPVPASVSPAELHAGEDLASNAKVESTSPCEAIGASAGSVVTMKETPIPTAGATPKSSEQESIKAAEVPEKDTTTMTLSNTTTVDAGVNEDDSSPGIASTKKLSGGVTRAVPYGDANLEQKGFGASVTSAQQPDGNDGLNVSVTSRSDKVPTAGVVEVANAEPAYRNQLAARKQRELYVALAQKLADARGKLNVASSATTMPSTHDVTHEAAEEESVKAPTSSSATDNAAFTTASRTVDSTHESNKDAVRTDDKVVATSTSTSRFSGESPTSSAHVEHSRTSTHVQEVSAPSNAVLGKTGNGAKSNSSGHVLKMPASEYGQEVDDAMEGVTVDAPPHKGSEAILSDDGTVANKPEPLVSNKAAANAIRAKLMRAQRELLAKQQSADAKAPTSSSAKGSGLKALIGRSDNVASGDAPSHDESVATQVPGASVLGGDDGTAANSPARTASVTPTTAGLVKTGYSGLSNSISGEDGRKLPAMDGDMKIDNVPEGSVGMHVPGTTVIGGLQTGDSIFGNDDSGNGSENLVQQLPPASMFGDQSLAAPTAKAHASVGSSSSKSEGGQQLTRSSSSKKKALDSSKGHAKGQSSASGGKRKEDRARKYLTAFEEHKEEDRKQPPADFGLDRAPPTGVPKAAITAQDMSEMPCTFFQLGSCINEDRCPFSHDMAAYVGTEGKSEAANMGQSSGTQGASLTHGLSNAAQMSVRDVGSTSTAAAHNNDNSSFGGPTSGATSTSPWNNASSVQGFGTPKGRFAQDLRFEVPAPMKEDAMDLDDASPGTNSNAQALPPWAPNTFASASNMQQGSAMTIPQDAQIIPPSAGKRRPSTRQPLANTSLFPAAAAAAFGSSPAFSQGGSGLFGMNNRDNASGSGDTNMSIVERVNTHSFGPSNASGVGHTGFGCGGQPIGNASPFPAAAAAFGAPSFASEGGSGLFGPSSGNNASGISDTSMSIVETANTHAFGGSNASGVGHTGPGFGGEKFANASPFLPTATFGASPSGANLFGSSSSNNGSGSGSISMSIVDPANTRAFGPSNASGVGHIGAGFGGTLAQGLGFGGTGFTNSLHSGPFMPTFSQAATTPAAAAAPTVHGVGIFGGVDLPRFNIGTNTSSAAQPQQGSSVSNTVQFGHAGFGGGTFAAERSNTQPSAFGAASGSGNLFGGQGPVSFGASQNLQGSIFGAPPGSGNIFGAPGPASFGGGVGAQQNVPTPPAAAFAQPAQPAFDMRSVGGFGSASSLFGGSAGVVPTQAPPASDAGHGQRIRMLKDKDGKQRTVSDQSEAILSAADKFKDKPHWVDNPHWVEYRINPSTWEEERHEYGCIIKKGMHLPGADGFMGLTSNGPESLFVFFAFRNKVDKEEFERRAYSELGASAHVGPTPPAAAPAPPAPPAFGMASVGGFGSGPSSFGGSAGGVPPHGSLFGAAPGNGNGFGGIAPVSFGSGGVGAFPNPPAFGGGQTTSNAFGPAPSPFGSSTIGAPTQGSLFGAPPGGGNGFGGTGHVSLGGGIGAPQQNLQPSSLFGGGPANNNSFGPGPFSLGGSATGVPPQAPRAKQQRVESVRDSTGREEPVWTSAQARARTVECFGLESSISKRLVNMGNWEAMRNQYLDIVWDMGVSDRVYDIGLFSDSPDALTIYTAFKYEDDKKLFEERLAAAMFLNPALSAAASALPVPPAFDMPSGVGFAMGASAQPQQTGNALLGMQQPAPSGSTRLTKEAPRTANNRGKRSR